MSIKDRNYKRSLMRTRHSDGIKEIGQRLIEKIRGLIDKFKSLSTGRKITVLLARLAQIASAIIAAREAKNFDTIKSEYKKFVKVRGQIQKVGWDYVKQDYGNSGLLGRKYEEHLNGFVKPTLKIILSLAGAFVAQIVTTRAKRNERHEDAGEGAALLQSLGITAAALGVGYFIHKLLGNAEDEVLIKKIRRGDVTEQDIVRKLSYNAIAAFTNTLRTEKLNEEQVEYINGLIRRLQTCRTFTQLKKLVASKEIDKLEKLYNKAKTQQNFGKNDSSLNRRHNDIDLKSIAGKAKELSGKLVGEVRIAARNNPGFAKMLSAAIGMTAFWDVVEGVRSIGDAGYKTFKRLFSNVEQYKRYYSANAILEKLVKGIGRLGLAFFKYKAASKVNAFSNGY